MFALPETEYEPFLKFKLDSNSTSPELGSESKESKIAESKVNKPKRNLLNANEELADKKESNKLVDQETQDVDQENSSNLSTSSNSNLKQLSTDGTNENSINSDDVETISSKSIKQTKADARKRQSATPKLPPQEATSKQTSTKKKKL